MTITLTPRAVTRFLAAIILLLLLAHLAGKISAIFLGRDTLHGLIPLFDLTQERNVPTFYSAVAILVSAALAGMVAVARRSAGAGDFVFWGFVSALLLLLAADELFQLHEQLTRPTRSALGMASNAYFAWTIPMGILTLLVGALSLRFVLRLPTTVRNLVLLAGSLFVVGALGMELVGGMMVRDPHDLGRVLVNALEEVLEMVGIVVLIRALLLYLERLSVVVSIGRAPDEHRAGDAERAT